MIALLMTICIFGVYLLYDKYLTLKSDVSVWPQYSSFKLKKIILQKILRTNLINIKNRTLNKSTYINQIIEVFVFFLCFYSLNKIITQSNSNIYYSIEIILLIKFLIIYKSISTKDYSYIKLIHKIIKNLSLLIAMMIIFTSFPLTNLVASELYNGLFLTLGIIITYRNFRMLEFCENRKNKVNLISELTLLIIIVNLFYQNNLWFFGITKEIIVVIFPILYLKLGINFKKMMHKNILHTPKIRHIEQIVIFSIIIRIVIWKY